MYTEFTKTSAVLNEVFEIDLEFKAFQGFKKAPSVVVLADIITNLSKYYNYTLHQVQLNTAL